MGSTGVPAYCMKPCRITVSCMEVATVRNSGAVGPDRVQVLHKEITMMGK